MFSKKLLFFLFLVALSCEGTSFFEQAAFRVQDRAFYITDVNQYIEDLNHFRCLKPNSLFMRGVGFKKQKIASLGSTKVDIKGQKDFFSKIVNVVILSRFIQEKQREKLPVFKTERCFKGAMSRDLKGLLRTEIFLQDRFLRSGKAADLKTLRTFLTGLRKKTDYEIFD